MANRNRVARWVLIAFLVTWCVNGPDRSQAQTSQPTATSHQQFLRALVAAAVERTHHTVRYDPAYVRIPYPGGDVPAGTGVCTDEIIRSYRAVGVDLQKETRQRVSRLLYHLMLEGARP